MKTKHRGIPETSEHVQEITKDAVGRWIFNLLGVAIIGVIIVVQVFQLQKKEINSIQFWADFMLLATFNVVMWIDQYCNGKCI